MALLIQNAVMNYVCIKTPKIEFGKKPDPKGEHINKEFIVDVLMPYASWKKFKKHYKKVGAIEKAKSFTAAEYEEAFKVKPPTDDIYKDEDGDYTLIKFRQRAYYTSNGDATKQPQVVGTKKIKNGNGELIGFKDAEGQDVGIDIEVGNGSVGIVQFRERTWTFESKPGLSLDLVAIQVVKLVPYEGSGDELGFDMDEEESEEGNPFAGGGSLADDDVDGDVVDSSGPDEGDEDGTGW